MGAERCQRFTTFCRKWIGNKTKALVCIAVARYRPGMNVHPAANLSTSTPTANLLLRVLVVAGVVAGLTLLSQYNFLLFHSLSELFSIAIGWAAFGMCWNSRERLQSGYLLILGVALLCVGAIDMVHTVSYKGMGVFPKDDPNLPTQLWIAGRYLKGAAFVLAGLFLNRRIAPFPLLTGFLLVTAGLLGSIFLGWFPDCFIRGSALTQFKIFSEYLVCVLFLISGWLFLRGRRHLDPVLFQVIMAALVLSIAQEMLFTFYVSVYGLSNLLGHLTKVTVFWLLYYGIVRMGVAEPHRVLFRELENHRERLARSRDRLAEAQRVAGAGSWEWTADTGETLWSEQMYHLLNKDPDTFHPDPENLRRLFGVKAWETYKRHLLQCLRRDDQCEFEVTLRLPGEAEVRHLEITCRATRRADGRPERLLGMMRDVTGRRNLEAMREDVERILHHDIKSPIASLVSALKMLAQEPEIPAKHRSMLETMGQSARDVLQLVQRSVALRRIEEGQFTPARERVNVMRLLGQVRTQTKRLRTLRSVSLSIHMHPDGEKRKRPDTRGDAPLLQSMLDNLIRNAVEAAPRESTVTVHVGNSHGVNITIHNQGTVPKAVRHRFFDKYATHGKTDGTGLGTYSAKLIAEAHGGKISMRTGQEHGTIVTVRLPVFGEA